MTTETRGSGFRFEGYTVLQQLGLGPLGPALLAKGPDGHPVELRFLTHLPPAGIEFEALEERLRRVGMLKHPLLRAVVDAAVEPPTPVVVLDWPSDQTLADRLREGPMLPRLAIALTERLAHAVGAGHRLGLVHGALGPSGVRLDGNGKPKLEFTGVRPNTEDTADAFDVACRPPEWGKEEVDRSTDAYSLCAMLLCMVLGRPPTKEELKNPESCTEPGVGEVLRSGLEEQRDARPSVAELCLRLRELLPEKDRSGAALEEVTGQFARKGGVSDELPDGFTASGVVGRGDSEGEGVSAGQTLGRFQLLRRLGEGGMGEVFEGMDLSNGDSVAIKVLRREVAKDEKLLQRFKKEARMLARVHSPYVANLLEVNFDRGVHFLALEFVEGGSVGDLLEKHPGTKLPEREALELIADACRALAEPHRRGIVHRDIKPENMMFVKKDHARVPGGPRVKLCDFGIARSVDPGERKETLQLTQEGMVIGTPAYMAPEQCRAMTVGPGTDVYALGITLFQLIAGKLPFEAEDPVQFLVKHLTEMPPSLHDVESSASEGVSKLVAKCLAKEVTERYADAGELLEAIEKQLRGEPTGIQLHPALPQAGENEVKEIVFEWDLEATPEQLWPYVANSDRLNRAVGMAAPKFEFSGVSDVGEGQRVASNRVAGLDMKWKEAPFEWVEGRRWGSYRVFDTGPLKWFIIDISMSKRPQGGTHLRYTMRFVPSGWLFGIITKLEMRFKQHPRLDAAFRKIDGMLTGKVKNGPEVDGYEPPAKVTRAAEELLARVSAQLLEEGHNARVVESIVSFVRSAPDSEVVRLRPLAFAERFELPPEEVVKVCLHAARKGMLLLSWEVLCPLCRVPSSFADSLREVESHANCGACAKEFQLDFAKSIELVFRASPAVRKTERKPYCVGGPALFPHVAAQLRLRAGERFQLALNLEPGQHRLRSPQLANMLEFRVSGGGELRRLDLQLGEGSPFPGQTAHLLPGEQVLSLENTLSQDLLLRVERMAPRMDALTAAKAAALPAFRELFPEEVLAPGQLVSVTNTALLATNLEGADALFNRLGDTKAFELVLKHFRSVGDVVHACKGAVVRTLDAGVLAAFEHVEDAARAATELQSRLTGQELSDGKRLPAIRIALHQGPVMAATVNERLDYFGQNVSVLWSLLEETEPGELVCSRTVAEELAVAQLFREKGLTTDAFPIPGWGAAMWAVRMKRTKLASS